MPRTAAFVKSLADRFGDEVCPITQEGAEEIRGGLLTVDGFPPPFERQSLLHWMDLKETNPLTNTRLPVDAIHPVLTPRTNAEDYGNSVRELATRGWRGESEVASDARAYDAYWERQNKAHYHMTAHLPTLLDAMRIRARRTLWAQFNEAPAENRRRLLDSLMLGQVFMDIQREGERVNEFVKTFIYTRIRVWRFPDGADSLPIYMDVQELSRDFVALCRTMSVCHNASETEVAPLMWALFEQEGYDRAAYASHTGKALVLYAPTVAEWLRHILLPGVLDINPWRRPQWDILLADDIWELQQAASVDFGFTMEAIRMELGECFEGVREKQYGLPDTDEGASQWMRRYVLSYLPGEYEWAKTFHSAEEFATYIVDAMHLPFIVTHAQVLDEVKRVFKPRETLTYALVDETQIQRDERMLPSDPYTNPRLLPALEYGLMRLDAEIRAADY